MPDTPANGPASSTSMVLTNPSAAVVLPPTYTSPASNIPMPSTTDFVTPANTDSTINQQSNNGVLNYYFLLLAIFVIIVAMVWWSLIRRRRQKMVQSRYNGQSALARDLEGMPGGRRWVNGRFGFPREPTPEEGLDERGQAPPPYMPASPEAAVHPTVTHSEPRAGSGLAIPLQNLSGEGQKPPNYQEHLTTGPDNTGIGPSAPTPPVPNGWYRPWYRNKQRMVGTKPNNP